MSTIEGMSEWEIAEAEAMQAEVEAELQARRDYVSALRMMANVVEANPSVVVPYHGTAIIRVEDVEQLRREVKAYGGKWDKDPDDSSYVLRRKLAYGLELYIYSDREKVCKRVVVGKERVPETVIPAKPEQVVPAHEKEIVEWHCPQVMKEG